MRDSGLGTRGDDPRRTPNAQRKACHRVTARDGRISSSWCDPQDRTRDPFPRSVGCLCGPENSTREERQRRERIKINPCPSLRPSRPSRTKALECSYSILTFVRLSSKTWLMGLWRRRWTRDSGLRARDPGHRIFVIPGPSAARNPGSIFRSGEQPGLNAMVFVREGRKARKKPENICSAARPVYPSRSDF